MKLFRGIHEFIVKQYIPNDDQQELAEALFNWKNKK